MGFITHLYPNHLYPNFFGGTCKWEDVGPSWRDWKLVDANPARKENDEWMIPCESIRFYTPDDDKQPLNWNNGEDFQGTYKFGWFAPPKIQTKSEGICMPRSAKCSFNLKVSRNSLFRVFISKITCHQRPTTNFPKGKKVGASTSKNASGFVPGY